jgi:hypothetical protein
MNVEPSLNSVSRWEGEGSSEVGVDVQLGRVLVSVDQKLHATRPIELDYLRGDASLATLVLGWRPTCTFKIRDPLKYLPRLYSIPKADLQLTPQALVEEMVQADIKLLGAKTSITLTGRYDKGSML